MSDGAVSVGQQAIHARRASSRFLPPLPDKLREVDLTLAAERGRVVDAEEIAAYLEADGLSDEVLRGRYGTPGLFDAAEQLYCQGGTGGDLHRRFVTPPPVFPWSRVLRGPLYLLPGLSGLLIARALGPVATDAFVYAAVFGWGWTTTIASVRYAEPFGVPGRAMRAVLLVGSVAGMVGGALVAARHGDVAGALSGTLSGHSVTAGAVVGGVVALSSAAAGILLSLHRTGPYLLAFASPLLAALALLAVPSAGAAGAALLLLAVMPLLSALHATRPAGTLAPRWTTLRRHVPPALLGWTLAMTFVLLTGRLGAWTLLPLVLATGLLEGAVWHIQERLQRLARLHVNLRRLRRRGARIVVLGTVSYAAGLAAWAFVVPRLALSIPALPEAWAFLGLYAGALLLSAWLANHGRLAVLASLWAICGVVLYALPPTAPLAALSTVMTVLTAALTALALHATHDPRSYR